MRRYLKIWLIRHARQRRPLAKMALGLLGGVVLFGAYLAESSYDFESVAAVGRLKPPAVLDARQGATSIETVAPDLRPHAAATTRPAGVSRPGAGRATAPDTRTLRILALRDRQQPDQPAVTPAEQRLVAEYAREASRTPDWVLMDRRADLITALHAGEGDLIVGQHADPPLGSETALWTQPWGIARQKVVGRRGGDLPRALAELERGRIAVRRDSTAWPVLERHAGRYTGVKLVPITARDPLNSVLQRLAAGQYDLAVVPGPELEDHLRHHQDLGVAFELPGGKNLAWGVHPGAAELRKSLNRFLAREALSHSVAEVSFGDLPRITERNLLRLITYQSPANYYLDESGELRGFEYELVRRFARKHGLRVEVVVAPSQEEMLGWLLEGRGDLIAASMPAAGLRDDPRLSLSHPYNYAAPLIVGRKHAPALIDARDLAGRRIVLPDGSPYRRLLERYRQRGIDVDIREAGPGVTEGEILHRAAAGIYDLTVIGSHKVRSVLGAESRLGVHFPISEPLPHAWVMRAGDRQLRTAVNAFIEDFYRSRDYNILHARYFERPTRFLPLKPADSELLALGGELSPYDATVRENAERFGFDWRLIVAQMYQESRFKPDAESSAGALGLMQMLPSTASELGVNDLSQPEQSIRAGVQYLRNLFGLFEGDLAFEDRTWFALAAYNAGFQRVQQAREKARVLNLDPNRWFGNVEKAMLSLAQESDCRCRQPVVYVREIRARYHNYVRLTQAAQYAASEQTRTRQDT